MVELLGKLRACFLGKRETVEVGDSELERFKRALKEGTSLDPDSMSEADLRRMFRKLNRK